MRPARFARLIASLSVCAFALPATAQSFDYESCTALIESDPNRALGVALEGMSFGAGHGAEHCHLLAQAELDDFWNAAFSAELLARDVAQETARVNILAQAGEFYLAARDAPAALRILNEALQTSPEHVPALDARARASAALGDFEAAIGDLNTLLAQDPENAELYSLRAAARRRNGDLEGAVNDASSGVRYDGSSALAHFELGAAKASQGDFAAARVSWKLALAFDLLGEIGELAQANLDRLPPAEQKDVPIPKETSAPDQ